MSESVVDNGSLNQVKSDELDPVTSSDEITIEDHNRGEEGVLEGALIKDTEQEFSDSDDDDEGIVIIAGKGSQKRNAPYDRGGGKSFGRSQNFTSPSKPSTGETTTDTEEKTPVNEELKKLRYSHHRTAFDVDIDALDSHPWRNKNADISDYFNYGFNEKTWKIFCEEQLKVRMKMGLGPTHTDVSLQLPLSGGMNSGPAMSITDLKSTPLPPSSQSFQQFPPKLPPTQPFQQKLPPSFNKPPPNASFNTMSSSQVPTPPTMITPPTQPPTSHMVPPTHAPSQGQGLPPKISAPSLPPVPVSQSNIQHISTTMPPPLPSGMQSHMQPTAPHQSIRAPTPTEFNASGSLSTGFQPPPRVPLPPQPMTRLPMSTVGGSEMPNQLPPRPQFPLSGPPSGGGPIQPPPLPYTSNAPPVPNISSMNNTPPNPFNMPPNQANSYRQNIPSERPPSSMYLPPDQIGQQHDTQNDNMSRISDNVDSSFSKYESRKRDQYDEYDKNNRDKYGESTDRDRRRSSRYEDNTSSKSDSKTDKKKKEFDDRDRDDRSPRDSDKSRHRDKDRMKDRDRHDSRDRSTRTSDKSRKSSRDRDISDRDKRKRDEDRRDTRERDRDRDRDRSDKDKRRDDSDDERHSKRRR